MSPQRRKLDDDAAAFVFGDGEPPAERSAPKQETSEPKSPPRKPSASASKKTASKPPAKKTRAIDKLMQTTNQERQVRITVDLAESQHRGLTMAAAQLGQSKADIIRALLEDFLADLNQ